MRLGTIEKHISVHTNITARGAFFYRIGNPCDRATAKRISTTRFATPLDEVRSISRLEQGVAETS